MLPKAWHGLTLVEYEREEFDKELLTEGRDYGAESESTAESDGQEKSGAMG